MRKSFDLELMSNEEMLYYPGLLIQAFSRFKKEIKKKKSSLMENWHPIPFRPILLYYLS